MSASALVLWGLLFSQIAMGTIPEECPDLALNDRVDFADFAVFAQNWRKTRSSLAGDFDGNGSIDFGDLKLFAGRWLERYPAPTTTYNEFRESLAAGNVASALTYIAESQQQKFSEIFQAIGPNLGDFVTGMGNMTLVSEQQGRAVYEMNHQDGSTTYKFLVVFVKDDNGNWKLYNL